MTDIDEEELEHEKTESYELGHISQLEVLEGEMRERAGERWAHSNNPTDTKIAKVLKKLANEFGERAEEKREEWEEKHRSE